VAEPENLPIGIYCLHYLAGDPSFANKGRSWLTAVRT